MKLKRKAEAIENKPREREEVWPCPKNNKFIGRRTCWLINRFLPGRSYGNFDCWQCFNLLRLRRGAYKRGQKLKTAVGVFFPINLIKKESD